MTITKIAKDATFSASTTVMPGGKAVGVTFSARKSENSDRYAVTSQLDFSECSQSDILELATKTCIIDLQRQWRVLANAPNSTATTRNPFEKVNVKKAIVESTRSTGTPVQRATSALAKLSPTERAAIMKALQAEMATPQANQTNQAKKA